MTTPTMVGLSIPADYTQPVAVVAVEPTLEGIRQYVGEHGTQPYVEVVHLGERAHMWMDEDGRALALAHNRRASLLADARVLGGDDVRGDVLVLGSTSDGEEASLTVSALGWLTGRLGLDSVGSL